MYRLLFSLVLRRLPAEVAHRVAVAALRALTRLPGVAGLLRRLCGPADPVLRVTALGMSLAGPLGLAAGFDKNAIGYSALGTLGFGFVEIGTVTAHAQPGNPTPRLFRLPSDRALVNRLGFNNEGSAVVAGRLRRGGLPLGVNIGRTKAAGDAIADYVTSARRLGPHADYVAVNVSSPNTPGLRDLQATTHLGPLLTEVRAALDEVCERHVPLLVKIAPDLADADIDAVADLALRLGLDGIIATNTTVTRTGLTSPQPEIAAAGSGGLSGAPLRARALEVLRRLRARVGDRVVLIGVGGIMDADDAWDRIRAGATLLQGYTGLIYGGPFWVRRINRGLAARVRGAGLRDITEAIAADVRPTPPETGRPPDL